MRRIALGFLVLCATLHGVSFGLAEEQAAAIEKRATALYQEIMSPFCAGRSLNDCPSSKAQELKDEMKLRLEAGESPDVIREDVIARFGEQYRAVPVFAGFGVFVWIVPVGFVVLGLAVALLVSLGRRRSVVAPSGQRQEPISEDMAKRLRDELSKLD
jgi:cytochrome c-type biogenesis protein CcmH